MAEIKLERNVRRKFHYTQKRHLDHIIRDGFIRKSDYGFRKKRQQAVWVSTNQEWEPTAKCIVAHPDNELDVEKRKCDTHFLGGGLVRIEVEDKSAPFNWKQYVKNCKMSGEFKRMMEFTGKELGGNPQEWYVSFKPITSEDWLAIESYNWESQTWVPYEQ